MGDDMVSLLGLVYVMMLLVCSLYVFVSVSWNRK